jgi:hypothetical protein
MELYFCGECQISIPQGEIESGVATSPDGQHFCAEHRTAGAAAGGGLEPDPFELLFCSNCRVSIPQTDARSGRARRQYGSLMCAVCSKADPGERAARREAVEAEMNADVDENDPLAAFSAVPVATASPAMSGSSSSSGRSGSSFAVLVVLVFGACLVAGVAGGSLLLRDDPVPQKDWAPELARVETQLQDLQDKLEDAQSENRKLRKVLEDGLEESSRGIEARVSERQKTLTGQLGDLAQRSDAANRQLAEKAAKHEGMLSQLSEQVKALTASMGNRRDSGGGNEKPPAGGNDEGGAGPVVPPAGNGDGAVKPDTVRPPDPKVVQLCNDLLDPTQDDSVRFPAATELGRLGDVMAIPYLSRALLADQHFLVRRACARSLGTLKAWNSTPMLIQALQDKEAYVAQQASYALQSITAEDWGVTQDQALGERKRRAREAARWWEKNEASPPDGVSLHTAKL